MKKKWLLLFLTLVLVLTFAGCGKADSGNGVTSAGESQQSESFGAASETVSQSGYSYSGISEDDFEITLDIPKTELKVGESETITARLYNNSGKRIPICDYTHEIGIFIKEEAQEDNFGFTASWQGGYIEKDSYVEKTEKFEPEKAGKYIVKAIGRPHVILNGDDIDIYTGVDGEVNEINIYAEGTITVVE